MALKPTLSSLEEYIWTDPSGQTRCVWGYPGDIAFLKDLIEAYSEGLAEQEPSSIPEPAPNVNLLAYDQRNNVKQVTIRGCAELTNRLFRHDVDTNDIQEVFVKMLGE